MKFNQLILSTNCNIGEGTKYQWACYGPFAYVIDLTDANNKHIASCCYDSITSTVYEITVFAEESHPYIWWSKKVREAHHSEAAYRGINPYVAWDGVVFEELTKKDILSILRELNNRYGM